MKIELNYPKADGTFSVTVDTEVLEIVESFVISKIECSLTAFPHELEQMERARELLGQWYSIRQIIGTPLDILG